MKQSQKILVLGGMHGNEKLGLELIKLLKSRPISNVDALIANPRATELGSRFVETDLNRSFGKSGISTYEERRAQRLRQIVNQYDLVLDFHNTQTSDNNCSFVGVKCNPILYDISKKLGLYNCIEATYDCINKYCPNVLSVEISIGDRLDNAKYWYAKLRTLMSLPAQEGQKLTLYRYWRRVEWDESVSLQREKWEPFQPIPDNVKKQLMATGVVVPIFIASTLTPYYATLLKKEKTQ